MIILLGWENTIINLSFQGHYNENSWAKIEALTTEEILDTINHKNVSGIFLKVSFVVVAVVVVVIFVVVFVVVVVVVAVVVVVVVVDSGHYEL